MFDQIHYTTLSLKNKTKKGIKKRWHRSKFLRQRALMSNAIYIIIMLSERNHRLKYNMVPT